MACGDPRFIFSDTLQVGGYMHASGGEGEIDEVDTADEMAEMLPDERFTGVVCMAD